MKTHLTIALLFLLMVPKLRSQSLGNVAGVAAATAITVISMDAGKKEIAKEISQFRSKEFIMNEIIGPVGDQEVKFETESLASDNSAGLISVAFNCNKVNQRGLLLAFFGDNVVDGELVSAYAFNYLPLSEAQALLNRLVEVKERNKDYLSDENDVNNVYIEYKDMKFIIYRDGTDLVRVFWNGFEVVWERSAFNKTQRRLNKWFD